MALQLANYSYEYKTDPEKQDFKVEEVLFGGQKGKELLNNQNFGFYRTVGACKNYARDLANGRANIVNTEYFLEEAKSFAKANPNVVLTYLVGEELVKEGLLLHHAVGRASRNPPILINLSFSNNPSTSDVHALVGKGLTFDTGGLHVKPYGSMEEMYADKGGASAVFAAFRGIVELGLKVNVTCTLGMAENSLGSNSYRPSDIIKSYHV